MDDRCRVFRQLHETGCFVIPNPWDIGSAKVLVQLGFKALATTSAGFAWVHGLPDHGIRLDQKLAHLRVMTEAVEVPVNADFERGFAIDPERVGANVSSAAKTGVAGLSIEDSSGDPSEPLFDLALSVERMRAAREALDKTGTGVMLTGRSEGFLVGRPDLSETIRRLQAYAEAGAECLFAPGLRSVDDIKTVVRAVAPTPVNVLVAGNFSTVAQLADAGVRRISVGSSLARAAWTGFLQSAKEIAEQGTFTGLGQIVAHTDLNKRFSEK
jgi:methylisocitrate lyase